MLVYKYTWPLTDPGLGRERGERGGEGKRRREKGTGMPALAVLPQQSHDEKVAKDKNGQRRVEAPRLASIRIVKLMVVENGKEFILVKQNGRAIIKTERINGCARGFSNLNIGDTSREEDRRVGAIGVHDKASLHDPETRDVNVLRSKLSQWLKILLSDRSFRKRLMFAN